MRKGPLKLYLLLVSCSCDPVFDLFWCSSCVNRSRLHSGVIGRICSDSYWWSPNLRTVMVFSFAKFPSKTLSSISFFPLAVLPFFTHIPTLYLPPSLILYYSPLLSLSNPCFFFFFLLSRLRSSSPCYSFSWLGRKWLGCFWILREYKDGAPFPVTLSSSGLRLLAHIISVLLCQFTWYNDSGTCTVKGVTISLLRLFH